MSAETAGGVATLCLALRRDLDGVPDAGLASVSASTSGDLRAYARALGGAALADGVETLSTEPLRRVEGHGLRARLLGRAAADPVSAARRAGLAIDRALFESAVGDRVEAARWITDATAAVARAEASPRLSSMLARARAVVALRSGDAAACERATLSVLDDEPFVASANARTARLPTDLEDPAWVALGAPWAREERALIAQGRLQAALRATSARYGRSTRSVVALLARHPRAEADARRWLRVADRWVDPDSASRTFHAAAERLQIAERLGMRDVVDAARPVLSRHRASALRADLGLPLALLGTYD
ncbi:MAG: hypothetical protein R3A52_03580 [Polyangiales bacterium]